MKISKDTRISKLIKENPDAIEVIASINKQFRKLKNPVLRKLLASRVSIADAAKIGGSSVDEFLTKLAAIGFEIDRDRADGNDSGDITHKPGEKENKYLTEDIMQELNPEKIVKLDVRPTIEKGEDPFKDILSAIKELATDGILQIINTFEPVPMINHLRDKGFESKTERPEPGIVHTFFYRTENADEDVMPEVENDKPDDFGDMLAKFGDHIKTIDVRHLEMPEPMVTILQEIEQLPEGHALFVHHKRIPQFLLPELKKRDFEIFHNEIDENNMNLLIYRKQ